MILTAEGPHFSFGASVEEHLPDQVAAMLEGFHGLFRAIFASDLPVLCAVRGMCLGGVHGAQRVLPGMLENRSGTLLFIGATASVKPAANFSAFGSAKFALRGLAQSLARAWLLAGRYVAGSWRGDRSALSGTG